MRKSSPTTEDLRQRFALRLNAALDVIGFPAKNDGRQTALARVMTKIRGKPITQKGVRKWLEGEAMPTEENRYALIQICQLSYQELFGEATTEKQSPFTLTTAESSSPSLLMDKVWVDAPPMARALAESILVKSSEHTLTDEDMQFLMGAVSRLSKS